MRRRFTSDEQRLALEYGRVARGKRKAVRKVFRRAVKMSGLSRRELAEALQSKEEEAIGFFQAAASKSDAWMRHFDGDVAPAPGERNWPDFFQALLECAEKFIPLIFGLF